MPLNKETETEYKASCSRFFSPFYSPKDTPNSMWSFLLTLFRRATCKEDISYSDNRYTKCASSLLINFYMIVRR